MYMSTCFEREHTLTCQQQYELDSEVVTRKAAHSLSEAWLVDKSAIRYLQHSLSGKSKKYIMSRVETQQGTPITYCLKSQGQTLLVGQKHRNAPQPLTYWRAKDRHCQQARNTAMHQSHSHTEGSRTGFVRRLEAQQGTTATHMLESQGEALSAGQNTIRHYRHSLPGEPRTGFVSRPEHKTLQLLTSWRVHGRHCQQARNTERHHSHSLSRETRTGIVSRI